MAISRALRRLFHIRELQEELGKVALAAARTELTRLEDALHSTTRRAQSGRKLVGASARNGDTVDRSVGLEEVRIALHLADALSEGIANAEVKVNDLQGVYLAHRVERRQAETLLENAEALDGVEAARKSQHELDDWFLSRGTDKNRDKE
jgi:flagellar export protein FliJ